ncbi:GGDEF domain-containing protein [Roseateles saccharophilus]|uniref:diguanylate cyclase n=1 Tax=Roseateles saccharophilus TaxID=304 RepID=A0A4R3UNM7_ROSSA|nr:GGDEF domain-containing protein [Roseateles saccharophilus]MDG0833529.1 GGDEF domain-containing protein [Roseateles saccharophilus]TCU92552.1 diguanylate cyclase (GGDEF)-like protein [Roseateles saccharophilus]
MSTLSDSPKTQIPSLLHKLGKMTAIRDTGLLEQSLLKTLCPMLGLLESSLYRTDDLTAAVRVLHHHQSRVVESDGLARSVERTEQIYNSVDVPTEVKELLENVRLLGKPCTRKRTQASDLLIAYPLFGGREICGYFVFNRDREVTLAEDAIIKGVLEVFSNYYDLLDASQRDRLTGLLNRQALENSFDRIWTILSPTDDAAADPDGRRVPSSSRAHWVAVIDVDHFKNVNDSFGHVVGDEVLLLVSRVMMAELRSSDLLFRYGGEEFVALFSAPTADDAREVLERLRRAVERHSFPQVGHVTVSAGLSLADPSELPQEVLSCADRALYQAKRTGRNRVCDYQALLASGELEVPGYGGTELF